MSILRTLGLPCIAVTLAATPWAAAQTTPPDYGFTWSTITHPGNRAANPTEAPYLYPPISDPALPVGAVDHVYRITTTEVSVTQWHEFVRAYAPYAANPADLGFTGIWIDHAGGRNYTIVPGAANRPTGMSWRYAARYVNWLHNDKRMDRSAFESGVYDTSTFHTNPDGTITDQPAHAPGARFWIPTLDEWTKAVYYDPDRYGDGQEGYWRYPNGSNTPLISGYPEDGGQTSAGLSPGAPDAHWLDVGSYPDVLTPWGLLDASGGVGEWTEYLINGENRVVKGTAQYTGFPEFADRIDDIGVTPPTNSGFIGLRLASVVPTPGTVSGIVLCLWQFNRRRRR